MEGNGNEMGICAAHGYTHTHLLVQLVCTLGHTTISMLLDGLRLQKQIALCGALCGFRGT
jgi:hypothetical protein